MRIVQISDLHLDPDAPNPNGVDTRENADWALREAKRYDPDLVVVSGDLALQMGTARIYQEAARFLETLSVEYLILPGNHDDRRLFAAAFGRRYRITPDYPWLDRHVNVGGTPMILLDSSDGVIDERQLGWLEVVLAEYSLAARRGESPPSLVVWTHHPVITGFHRFMDAQYPLRNAAEVRHALAAASREGGPEIHLLCGHYHIDDVRHDGALHQYCAPATYMQIDPHAEEFRIRSREPGVRTLNIDDRGHLTTSVVYRDHGEKG